MNGKQFRILAVLTVISGFLGGAVSNLALRGGPALAQGDDATPDVVRARRFELVDAEGRMRAALGFLVTGDPALRLFDAAGNTQAQLSVDDEGNLALVLCDAAEKPRASLMVLDDGVPGLFLYDAAGEEQAQLSVPADGGPGLWLRGAAGGTRALLCVPADGGPALRLYDAKGTGRATIGYCKTIQEKTGRETTFPESTITLFGEDGHVQWQAPGVTPAAPIVAPVAPLVVGSGLGNRYPGPMTGHWITDILEGGDYVLLEDGSLWDISFLDRIHTLLWLPTHKITILNNPGDVLYPYKLVNMNRDQVVEARYVAGR